MPPQYSPPSLKTQWMLPMNPSGSYDPAAEKVTSSGGGPDDDRGTVEFRAHFWDTTLLERGVQQEHSAFVREAGQWFYVGLAEGED